MKNKDRVLKVPVASLAPLLHPLLVLQALQAQTCLCRAASSRSDIIQIAIYRLLAKHLEALTLNFAQ